jgi:hypothetical protein
MKRLPAITLAGVLGLAAWNPLPSQCAPAPTPGHPPDCTRRDDNGDGYYDNGISSSGTTGTCTFSAEFQNAIGEPVVWVRGLCLGQFRDGAVKNITNSTGDVKASLYCGGAVSELSGKSKPS